MGTILRGRASVIMKVKEKMEEDMVETVCDVNVTYSGCDTTPT